MSLKTSLFVGITVALAFAANAYSQTHDLPQIQTLDVPPTPIAKAIEEAVAAAPKNATADEIFKYYADFDRSTLPPQGFAKFQDPLQVSNAVAVILADRILAMKDLTQEQLAQAIKLKKKGLYDNSFSSPEAAKEYLELVEQELELTKDEAELVALYRQKAQYLQIAYGKDAKPRVEALVQDALQRNDDNMKMFALQTHGKLIENSLKETALDPKDLEFFTAVINDKNSSIKVRFIAYVAQYSILSKADLLANNPESPYSKMAYELFEQFVDGDFPLNFKVEFAYIHMLSFHAQPYDLAMFDRQMQKLLANPQSELYPFGLQFKAEYLTYSLGRAKENQNEILKEIEKLVAQIELVKDPHSGLRSKLLSLKASTFIHKKDYQGLLEFVERELAKTPGEKIKDLLFNYKENALQKLSEQDRALTPKYNEFREFLKERRQAQLKAAEQASDK